MAQRTRPAPARPRDDAGVSLIEVLVAMGIMAILMAIVTGAVAQIYHAVNRVDSLAETQSQINTAFVRLDKEVRYARGVSDPAVVGGDYYVEYVRSVNSVDTCVELRLRTSTSELQRREWTKNASPLAPSAWTTLASNVTATTPFTVTAADSGSLVGFRYQRLTLAMTAIVGGGASGNTGSGRAGATRQTNVTFTALNATASTNSTTCIEARGVSS
jgi:prepilin-type N-terminal cleavage/methylation domain-containing protein